MVEHKWCVHTSPHHVHIRYTYWACELSKASFMFDNGRLQIKNCGWFPAGSEVLKALKILSDGAFRTYLYLSMSADRNRGSLSATYTELATELRRSRRSVSAYMEELTDLGICKVHPASNQHRRNQIEISDDFWPYSRFSSNSTESDASKYIDRVRSLLSARDCVRCTFSGADKNLAQSCATRGLPLEQVERGIALGCTRKYVSLLNGSDPNLIVSFAYFSEMIEEAGDENTPPGYWEYIAYQLHRLEEKWKMNVNAHANIASAAKPEKTRRDDG